MSREPSTESSRRAPAALACALLALLLWPAVVWPASIVVIESPAGLPLRTLLDAAPGEVNRLTVYFDGGGYQYRDDGAPIDRFAGDCQEGPSPSEVRCGDSVRNEILLYDGDDRARIVGGRQVPVGGYEFHVEAGAGSDEITVERSAAVRLIGEEGNDSLISAAGADLLEGGPDDDRLLGGPGRDEARYLDHFYDAVRVDLRRLRPQGSRGEVDTLIGIEDVQGSLEDDVLIGNQGANRLRGHEGDDTLVGNGGDDSLYGGGSLARPSLEGDDALHGGFGDDALYGGYGNDRLYGGPGVDRLVGGPGNDLISSADGRRETVYCGPGRDTAVADRLDRLVSCEVVRRG